MRRALVSAVLALLAALILSAAAPTARAQTSAITFYPETGHNVGLQIKQFFDANGGIATFGFPLTELIIDSSGLQVQYFERARFEYQPVAPPESRVSLSRLGAIVSMGRTDPAFQWLVASPDPTRQFFPESGHTLGGAFAWFWQTRGGLPIFGYPISEELKEWDPAGGRELLVQYFERARFEYHPENAGTPYEVMLSTLGRQLLDQDPLAQTAAVPARPLELIGQATTGFPASSTERVQNIGRATAMVNGFVVPPGAEFSFNSVGDFSEANGFAEGYGIVGGQIEKVIGGGLCQVSTTLFRAVSNAGLEITRRVGHSHIVYFYENTLGFDATVFTPNVDFRWRNDSPGPVYILGISDPSSARVTFQLWGISDGRSVRYEGPVTRNWKQPGVAVWQLDKSLPNGSIRQLVHGRPGADVTYNRIISFADGRSRTDTYFTRYTPWEDFFAYGPGVTPPAGVKVIPPK